MSRHAFISQHVSLSLGGAGMEGDRGQVREPGGGVVLALLCADACLQPAQLVGPCGGTQEAQLGCRHSRSKRRRNALRLDLAPCAAYFCGLVGVDCWNKLEDARAFCG